MKKLLSLVFLLALPALGDVTTTATFTDQQAARITRAMTRTNNELCKYFGLANGCTTVKMREQYCKRNGFGGQPIRNAQGVITGYTPLVSDCNGATQFLIYPTIDAYLKREMLKMVNDVFTKADEAEDRAAAKAAWDAKTQAQKDALCPSFGLTAPCTPF